MMRRRLDGDAALRADVLGLLEEPPGGERDHRDAPLSRVLQHRRARWRTVGGGHVAGVWLATRFAAGGGDDGHFLGAEAGYRRIQGVYAVRVVRLHHLQITDIASLHGGPGVLDGGKEP